MKTSSSRPYSSASLRDGLLIFALLQLYFGVISLSRFIAWDEGFYVLAARLVRAGESPYLDFFYPQAPLFPYFLALSTPFSLNWLWLRLFSATCAAITGMLLWFFVKKRYSLRVALITLGLYLGSHLVFGWFTTVKTYSFTALLLTTAYTLGFSNRSGMVFTSGVLLGMATNVRLYVLVVTPFFLTLKTVRRDITFLLGYLAGVLPAIFWIVSDFDAFWFNNLEYHHLRTRLNFITGLPYKRVLLEKMFLLKESSQFSGLEFWCWSILLTTTVALTLFKRIKVERALFICLTLIAVSWIPTPNYMQYFCLVVPFALLASAPSIALALQSSGGSFLLAVFFVTFISSYSSNLDLYTNSGIGLTGINNEKEAHLQTLAGVREVRNSIAKHVSGDEIVFSYWPGFLLELSNAPLAGSENHFTFRVGHKIKSVEKRQNLHLLSKEDSRVQIGRGIPDVVVVPKRAARRYYRKALQKGTYQLKDEVNAVYVYKKSAQN